MKRSELIALGIILFVSLVSARVFFQPVFFPTHDLEYHIIRLWQFDQNMRAGILIPRWAPDLNHGYGIPLFSFFYPLPNYVAETFRAFHFSYIESVYSTVAVGFILSPFAFYWWVRRIFTIRASVISSLFYLLAPYHLVDVYVRGSIGEVWIFALAPLVFGASTRIVQQSHAFRDNTSSSMLILGLSSAFLLLSHTVLGITFFFGGLGYSFLFALVEKKYDLSLLIKLLIGYSIGLLLSAYFYLPVMFESSYIRGLEIMRAGDHFPTLLQLLLPSWGSGFSVPGPDDSMSFQIGIAHVLVLISATVFVIKKKNMHMAVWVSIVFIFIFLMLEWSKEIWDRLSFLNYYQFPWRLLSVVIFGTSFLSGYVFEQLKSKYLMSIILVLFIFYFQYTYPVTYQKRSDEFYLSNPDWTNGTATLANSFNTIWFSVPPAPVNNDLESLPTTIRLESKTPTQQHYTVSGDASFLFTPHIAYFPGWEGKIDQNYSPVENENGLASLSVPAGTHSVVLKLKETPVQRRGVLLSLAGIIALMSISIVSYARRY